MNRRVIINLKFTLAGISLLGLITAAQADEIIANNGNQNSGPILKTSFNQNSKPHSQADRVLVEKSKRKLTLFSRGDIIKEYDISLGRKPEGHKVRMGDNKTPEGLYYIDYRVRDSDFHLALHISYPNVLDKLRARDLGVSPGGNIMLHGLKNEDKDIKRVHGVFDWTNGCIAVTNGEIEEIWKMVPNGTPIYILP